MNEQMNKQRLIVIGDTHGLATWQQIVQAHPDASFVFLGDYCDPYTFYKIKDEQVIEQLEAIILFKKTNPDRVTLLLGNHDVHYFKKQSSEGSRYNVNLMHDLKNLYTVNESLFQVAHQHGRLLFTHAGISYPWFTQSFQGNLNLPIASQLQDRREDSSLFYCGAARGGLELFGGIFWADKDELCQILPGFVQVVGHTRVPYIKVSHPHREDKSAAVIYTDSLYEGNYLLIEKEVGGTFHYFEAHLDGSHALELKV